MVLPGNFWGGRKPGLNLEKKGSWDQPALRYYKGSCHASKREKEKDHMDSWASPIIFRACHCAVDYKWLWRNLYRKARRREKCTTWQHGVHGCLTWALCRFQTYNTFGCQEINPKPTTGTLSPMRYPPPWQDREAMRGSLYVRKLYWTDELPPFHRNDLPRTSIQQLWDASACTDSGFTF